MRLLALLAQLFGAAAWAAPCAKDDAQVQKAAQWIGACAGETQDATRFSDESIKAAGTTREKMLSQCLELYEPCTSFLTSKGALPGRCGKLCRVNTAGQYACDAPPDKADCADEDPDNSKVGGAAPPGGVKLDASDIGYCGVAKGSDLKNPWDWIKACTKASREIYKDDSKKKEIMCNALGNAAHDRQSRGDDSVNLRNADHYLQGQCMAWSLHSSWMFNFTPALCTITGGYSALKIIPKIRQWLGTTDKPASKPDLEEVYWGCKGTFDGTNSWVPF